MWPLPGGRGRRPSWRSRDTCAGGEPQRLLMDFLVGRATDRAERDAVPELPDDARQRSFHPRTPGGDQGDDTRRCGKAMPPGFKPAYVSPDQAPATLLTTLNRRLHYSVAAC